jgi:sulfate adenylyltransferase subunit 2
MDVWQYIKIEKLELPNIYFTHDRDIVERNGVLLATSDYLQTTDKETVRNTRVRFRTVGDMTCTGAVESNANSIDDIIDEVASARVTERGGRTDDKRSETAMEDRKKDGYF